MIHHIDAIFDQGAFRPLEPLSLPEGTRVHLLVQDELLDGDRWQGTIRSPKLAHSHDAADFIMEVRELGDASV